MNRFLIPAIFASTTFASAADAPIDFDKALQPYLRQFCDRCHNAEKQEGEFQLDKLSKNVGVEDNPQWLEVMERINSGEMPPKDEANRPTADESARVVEWLALRMKEGEVARMARQSKVTYNRLTRDEYVYTVRDLIGVQFDATDPGNFLEDPEWHGFERLGSVLTLSPSNIEKYLAAAETILDEAYPEPPPPLKKGQQRSEPFGGTKPVLYEDQINERHREQLRELGLLDKVRFEMWPGDIFRYSVLKDPLPEAGIYEISYQLSGLRPSDGHAPRLKVYEQKLDRVLFEQDIVVPEEKPITVTFRAHLAKGRPSILVYNDVPGPSNNPRSGRHGNVPFISTKIGRIPWQMKLTDEQGVEAAFVEAMAEKQQSQKIFGQAKVVTGSDAGVPSVSLADVASAISPSSFIRVSLTPESHRGGLLTQASILSLTSDGVRHRPVHRGVWLSEAIFGKSPPPPPQMSIPFPPIPLARRRRCARNSKPIFMMLAVQPVTRRSITLAWPSRITTPSAVGEPRSLPTASGRIRRSSLPARSPTA